jgi:hypothetical protein
VEAPEHPLTIVRVSEAEGRLTCGFARWDHLAMSPTWIWMQVAIIVFVVAGMIIAVTKLA